MIKFLQKPGKVKKYILGGIILIFCGAMVISLTPMGNSYNAGSPGVLAKVDGEEITLQEAQQAAKQMAQQQLRGRSIPASLLPFFTQQAVERLVTQKAALAEAERMGLRVTDEDLRNYLKKIPALFPNGQYIGDEAYSALLQQNGVTVAQFEADTKKQLLIGMLQNVVEGSATVSDQEMQQEFVRRNTKVKFEYAVLTYDDILKQIKPTDAELKAFFERNKERYKNAVPEKRELQYVAIDPAKLADKVQVTPQDLRSYYSQHQDEYRVPEEVTLRQILIKTSGTDQKALDAARAKAQDVLNKVKAGGNFADLAKKYSEDPSTASNGGLLGAVRRGQTMPEIDKAAFSMNKGQTSDLLQTALGFFIIKVDDRQAAHLKSLDEVKSEIEPVIARDKANGLADNLAAKVRTDARANGLQAAATKNGLDAVSTGLVSASDSLPGIGNVPAFTQAAFQVQKENAPAETVQTPQGYVVFQVLAIQPPTTPTFEEIKAQVESDFKNERGGALFAQKLQQLADRAHAEHNLKVAAKEVGATVKTSELVKPTDQVPDIGIMSGPAFAAFSMKPGEISNAIQLQRSGVVISLLDKQEPPATEFASAKDEVREGLLSEKRGEMMALFISNLRSRMEKEKKIVIYQKEIEKLAPKGGLED